MAQSLIWIQAIWHMFLKDFSENVNFEKKSADSNKSMKNYQAPYGKAVFVRISDECAVNILRTALFTVIVRYIFTSCREYPANKVGLTKK